MIERAEVEDDSSTGRALEEMDELRRILLAPEQDEILRLRERLERARPNAENVAELLPEAVSLRTRKDDRLATALMPTIEDALGVSVKKDPHRLVDAIFPVMGPAIRKAISHAFSEMVQSINQTLEQSLSLKGLRWRWEAFRTGRPFAEVVLAHTLLYRVEQVFLIHKATGLLLQHKARGATGMLDSDLVSGMLTAIQDFVHDSFGAQKGDELESFQVGDFTIWIERGSQAILAAVIRGTAPQEYRRALQDALDAIHAEQREAMENFNGDSAPFATTRPHLESCLLSQLESGEKKSSAAFWVAASVVLLVAGLWLFFYIRAGLRWSDYIDSLKAEPGLVVVSEDRRWGTFYVTGLRDPLARDPLDMLKATDIAADDVVSRWEHYQSADARFIIARADNLLRPPASVSFKAEEGALRAEGFASREWIAEAQRLAAFIPGVAAFDAKSLIDADRARQEFEEVRGRVENRLIKFEPGSADIRDDQAPALDELASDIERLRALARSVGSEVRLSISGYTDPTGTEAINAALRRQRAENIFSALIARGISPEGLSASPAEGTARANQDRKVNFAVSLVDAARDR
ncbi:MAG: OmpA family protein [Acidobacteriota bacterium]